MTDLLAVVVDRSGSMYSIKEDAEGGINQFLEEQKKVGKARLTLAEFDDEYDVVHDDIDLKNFTSYELEPGGRTALFDAIGRTVSSVKNYKVDGKKILVIVTDGGENASKEFRNVNDIMKMISEMREDGWETIFIGADEATLSQARAMGIDPNTMFAFDRSRGGTRQLFGAVNAYSSSMRSGMKKFAAVQELDANIAASGGTLSKSNVGEDLLDITEDSLNINKDSLDPNTVVKTATEKNSLDPNTVVKTATEKESPNTVKKPDTA